MGTTKVLLYHLSIDFFYFGNQLDDEPTESLEDLNERLRYVIKKRKLLRKKHIDEELYRGIIEINITSMIGLLEYKIDLKRIYMYFRGEL